MNRDNILPTGTLNALIERIKGLGIIYQEDLDTVFDALGKKPKLANQAFSKNKYNILHIIVFVFDKSTPERSEKFIDQLILELKLYIPFEHLLKLLNQKDRNGDTPVSLARKTGKKELADAFHKLSAPTKDNDFSEAYAGLFKLSTQQATTINRCTIF